MKILIVDDSKAMRMIVKRTLGKAGFGDHTLEEAADGQEAFESISNSAPDLILCDWNMPRMSGIELLEKLKAGGSTIKFVFVTSEATAQMRELASEAGALCLISKPFTADTFKDVLTPLL